MIINLDSLFFFHMHTHSFLKTTKLMTCNAGAHLYTQASHLLHHMTCVKAPIYCQMAALWHHMEHPRG